MPLVTLIWEQRFVLGLIAKGSAFDHQPRRPGTPVEPRGKPITKSFLDIHFYLIGQEGVQEYRSCTSRKASSTYPYPAWWVWAGRAALLD